ncbi:phage protein NinX family protein [Enterobacter roggenkampii]|uniref:phage protein NinX family protein n=1 Tax=Enterobacter roggenkampii TaxID=1812935 RepID=UPI0011B9F2FC|nr:phage protein NinX family protein [Enterobacter roggenkampii]TWY19391.1 DUF2591 domain-containing protein [Enterobacter roggenkampii]
MDYSQLSDFEINSAVSMALLDKSANPSARYVAIGNYCNNPADAWPIIVENKIGLTPPMHDENWEAMTFDKFGYVNKNEYNVNPLRAAMIVFLLMKEKK